MAAPTVTARFDRFFDRPGIIAKMSRRVHAILNQTGLKVMYYMRKNMPYRKRISAPGAFPHSHEGTLRKLTLYDFESATSAIVGPTYLPSKRRLSNKPNPRLLNEGGVATIRRVFDAKKKKYRRTNRPIRHHYRPRPFVKLSLPFAADTLAAITDKAGRRT